MAKRAFAAIFRFLAALLLALGINCEAVASDQVVSNIRSVLLAPVSPEKAETLIAGRRDQGAENKGLTALAPSRVKSQAALPAPSAPIPASVSELARALKYNPVLIYEFVHNNIEIVPMWGVLKGDVGTLTDGMGSAFDIAQLTADLINADPAHGATATLVRGTIKLSDTAAASWIALNGMNVCPLASTFATVGIPVSYTLNSYPSCTGGGTLTIGHVWVKVVIGGTTYEIDPSFKTHNTVAASVNLASATGYSQASYLAAACSSCNTDPKVVTTLNRSALLNAANAQSMPAFARNLLSYLKTNNIHDLNQVIGGHSIVQTYVTALPALPYTVASRIADPFTIDGTWKPSLLVNFNGISQLFSSDAIYGHRLTITFNASNFPQLNLDGTVVQTGTTAVAPGSSGTVKLSMCMPFGGVNCSVGTVDGTGHATWCTNPSPVFCTQANLLSGGLYAVSNIWGPTSPNMVQRHQLAIIQASNAGIAPTAEANLGEVMTTLGLSWSEQASLYLGLSEDGQRNGGYFYYNVGIAGHTGSGGGPYVDLPGQIIFAGLNTALNGDGTYTSSIRQDNINDYISFESVLESTSVNQLALIPAMSTTKIADISASLTTQNNLYDLKTCADYTTYSPSLISYAPATLTSIQSLVCSSGYRVILPQRGNLTDPAVTSTPKWTGAGYYAFSNGFSTIISGGYAGGVSSDPQDQTTTVANANQGQPPEIVVNGRLSDIMSDISSGIGSFFGSVDNFFSSALSKAGSVVHKVARFVADPVDQPTGAFLNVASDISIGEPGSTGFLALGRSYTTGDIVGSSPFGQGWKSSSDIWASTGSDGVRAAGAYDAWEAADLLAAKYVSHDLLNAAAPPVLNVAVAAIGNRWISDRLVNNTVSVNVGVSAMSFQRLADDTYNPEQQSAARLSGSPSAWIITGVDGTQMAFGTPNSSGLAYIATIAQPNGVKTTFTYTSGLLSQVSNNLGRKLNFNWTGAHVTSVTDTPLLGAATRTVTYSYSGNLLQQVTDTRGGRTLYCYDGAGRMTSYFLQTQGSGTNCSASGANITNSYDSLGRVMQQVDAGGHVTDLYLAGTRAETVTHPGSGVADIRTIRYMDAFGNITRDINPRTALPTIYTFDALSRLVRTDFPEGNATEISYDIRSNPTQTCSIPKVAGAYPACNTSGTSSHIWTTIAYNEGASVWMCTAISTCNKPQSVTDPLGNVTSYTYNSDGTLASVTSPVPSGAAGAPKTVYTYTPTASLSGNVDLLTQVQVTSTAATTPTITTNYGYDTAANGLTLKTATLDPSGLNYITTFGYDGYGNQTSVDGPRTDVTDVVTTAYDAARNPTTITYPNPGTGPPATQIAYDSADRPTSIARKFGSFWMVACTTYTASGHVASNFGPWKTSSPTDCSFSGNTAVPSTSYGFDGADRLITTTVAEPTGNRVTQLTLFPDDRVQSSTRAAGTTVAATETIAYSNNGLPTSITDARGNITGMVYDGFDRLSLQQSPLAAGGGPSSTDVVAFAYDKRSALTKRSIRGTSDVSATCTQCIGFSYDQLGRTTQKSVPAIAANTSVLPNVAAVPGYTVYYGYDLISRPTSQGYTSGSPEVSVTYDNASRLLTSVQYGRTISYAYGLPSQGFARTMTWPASAGIMLSCYDALGRISQIKEAADCTTTAGQLVSYGYDDLSRRTSISRPSGVSSSYTYLDNGALSTLGHTLTGGSAVNYGFGYNRALQITSRSTDNDLYAWANNYNVNRGYTPNGLDQYSAVAAAPYVWDSRGNFLSGASWSYGYDGENRLAAVDQPLGTVTVAYDPIGRLRQIGASTTTQFLYDGSALIAEYNASTGTLTGRYVPGPVTDETAVAYDGAGTKTWYHTDAQGSVVAASDGSGASAVIDQYGPYGEPGLVYQGRNQGRLRYTGQIYLTEVMPSGGPSQPLYSYKARIYAPKLGRFLQTDPIGAVDDRNLYAYVGNDPINRADPSGLAAEKAYNKVLKPIGHGIASFVQGVKGALSVEGQENIRFDNNAATAAINHPGATLAIATIPFTGGTGAAVESGELTIGEILTGSNADTLIHLTPESAEAFSGGVDEGTSFARLGDVAHMTVPEYQANIVGFGAEASPENSVSGFVIAPPGTPGSFSASSLSNPAGIAEYTNGARFSPGYVPLPQ